MRAPTGDPPARSVVQVWSVSGSVRPRNRLILLLPCGVEVQPDDIDQLLFERHLLDDLAGCLVPHVGLGVVVPVARPRARWPRWLGGAAERSPHASPTPPRPRCHPTATTCGPDRAPPGPRGAPSCHLVGGRIVSGQEQRPGASHLAIRQRPRPGHPLQQRPLLSRHDPRRAVTTGVLATRITRASDGPLAANPVRASPCRSVPRTSRRSGRCSVNLHHSPFSRL
jgi:hypothetical protein